MNNNENPAQTSSLPSEWEPDTSAADTSTESSPAETTSSNPPDPAPATTDQASATNPTATPGDENAEPDVDSVMLGGDTPPDSATTPPGDETKPGETKPGEETKPDGKSANAKPADNDIKIEDYAKHCKLTLDNDPKGENVLDVDALNAVAPTLKELGVKPEDANKLVNALASYQLKAALNANRQRFEDNKKQRVIAESTYSKKDFETISRAIDTRFKPGGVMNFVIRHSELGNDLEFLALMKEIGEKLPSNGGVGAAAGAGVKTSEIGDGYNGIAAAWN